MNDQNIWVRLSTNVAQFKAQMGVAAAAVKQTGMDAAAAAGKANAGSKKIAAGMVAVGVAAGAMAAAAVAAAAQLETRMQNVATIWTDASLSIEAAGDRIVDMSQTLPQSAATLAEGLYDIASSGFQGAAALEVLEASATAASAGLTDTATAARAITAVLNAYGLTADQASTVSDVLFQTVNLGVVTFEQLANTMGDFVGSAAVAGVSIDEANTALATMTLTGVSASEAGTSLNRVLQEFIKPSEGMAAMLERLGYATGLEALEAEGLRGIMEKLRIETGGNATEMATLFNEIRGLRGALALIAAEGDNYNRVAAGMTDETQLIGATARALEEQQKSTSYQFQILKNSVVAAAISLGESLLPAIKAIVGAFQAAVDVWNAIPAPLQTIIGVGTILAGLLVGMAGTFILLSPAIMATGPAWAVFTGGVTTATTAVRGFMASLGPIGWAITGISAIIPIATGLWAKHKKEQAETKRRVDELKQSLDSQTGSITAQTEQLVRDKIVKDDLDKKAKQLNVSLETLAKAMIGDAAAAAEVEAATEAGNQKLQDAYVAAMKADGGYAMMTMDTFKLKEAWDKGRDAADDLNKAVDQQSGDLKKASKELEREKEVAKGTEGALAALTRANQKAGESQRQAAEEAEKHRQALEELGKSMAKAFDPSAAISAAEDAYGAASTKAFDKATDDAKRALDDRHEVEREALDDTLDLERERWEESARLRHEALEAAHEDELAALAATHEEAVRLLEERHEEEDRLFEFQARQRRNDLDDSIRDERRAMDARLAVLDEEYSRRKKKAEKEHERQREELEFTIRTTWGATREAAIAQLAALDDAHDEAMFQMEQGHDAEVQGIKDAQSDSERAQKQGLDDQLDQEKTHLDDRQAEEAQAEKDRYDAQVKAAKDRYDAQKVALDNELKQLKKALEDDHEERRRHLEDVQELENTKADERREAARTKHQLSLSQLSAQLEELNQTHETKLANLKTIWERSGRNLSEAMLTELAALDPKIVAELANTGQDSFDGFMGRFKKSVEGVDAGALATTFQPFSDKIKGLLAQVAEFGGMDMMANVAKGLTNDPAGAERLQKILAELMAPKEISPGVYGVPKPGGGYYPIKMGLGSGGVVRFADGGEHHVAQYAPAGAWRVWAEPETGGESYIPWARSKRGRSLSVLAQTANAFGYDVVPMANGGVLGGAGAGGVTNNVSVHVRVAAGVDPDAVGVAVRREVERALDGVARQVTVKAWRG